MTTFALEPIGWISAPRTEAIDDDWGEIVAGIDPARRSTRRCCAWQEVVYEP